MDNQFTLKELLQFLKKNLAIILIISITAGILTFVGVSYGTKPTYQSDASFFITPTYADGAILTPSGYVQELSYTLEMIPTYIEIFQGKDFLETLIDKANIKASYTQVSKLINYNSNTKSTIITVTVNTNNPTLTKRLYAAFQSIVPGFIDNNMNLGQVKFISSFNSPVPIYKPAALYAAVIFAISAILVYVLLFLKNSLTSVVNSESMIAKKYNITVLGTIPDFTSFSGAKSDKAYKKRSAKA